MVEERDQPIVELVMFAIVFLKTSVSSKYLNFIETGEIRISQGNRHIDKIIDVIFNNPIDYCVHRTTTPKE